MNCACRILRTKSFRKKNGDRPDVPNVAVVMTDGLANIKVKQAFKEAQSAKAADISVFAVGVHFQGKAWHLNKLASRPLSKFKMSVSDFDQLPSIRRQLSDAICDGEWRPYRHRNLSWSCIVGNLFPRIFSHIS